jgi:hypothetical protein
VGELTGYRDETTEEPDLSDRHHDAPDVIAVHIGRSECVFWVQGRRDAHAVG